MKDMDGAPWRTMTMNLRDDRHPIALRVRRCWLALAGDPCRTMVFRPIRTGACASPWHSVFLVLSPW